MRWPHARHARHVRQPAVSQRRCADFSPAHPLAADAFGRHRRRDVRQRTAGNDDGSGCNERSAVRAGAGRCHIAARERRRCGENSDPRRAICTRTHFVAGGGRPRLPRVRHTRRRLPISRHGGDLASGGGSVRDVTSTLGARALGPAGVDGHGCAVSARGVPARSSRRRDARYSFACEHPQRDGRPRRIRRLDEFAVTHSSHRSRRWFATSDSRRLDRRQPAGASHRGRVTQRPDTSSNRARVSRRRRAGSDAALATAW